MSGPTRARERRVQTVLAQQAARRSPALAPLLELLHTQLGLVQPFLADHLGKAADELLELFVVAIRQGLGKGVDTSVLVDALRPAAGEGARIIFGQQLERAIEELLADTKRLRR